LMELKGKIDGESEYSCSWFGGEGIWAFLEKKNSTQWGSFIRIKKKGKKEI
jgi:hypothetical protein